MILLFRFQVFKLFSVVFSEAINYQKESGFENLVSAFYFLELFSLRCLE